MSTLSQFLGSGGGDVKGSTNLLAPATSPALLNEGNSYYIRTGTSVSGLPKSTLNAIIGSSSDFVHPANPIYMNTTTGEHVELVYGNGVYVRGGLNGSLRSTDGVNWTPIVFSTIFNQFQARTPIVFGNGIFATIVWINTASGAQATIFVATSTDAENWTIQPVRSSAGTPNGSIDNAAISFAGGAFYLGVCQLDSTSATYYDIILRSVDAKAWVIVYSASSGAVSPTGSKVVFEAGSRLIAVSQFSSATTGYYQYASSDNGLTWSTGGQSFQAGICGTAYGNSIFVAGTYRTVTGTQLYTTTDGITWTARTLAAGTSGTNLTSVAFGAGLFVIVGGAGVIQTSPDGITWTARTNPLGTGVVLYHVSYDPTVGFIALVGSNNNILRSADGITWTSVNVPIMNRTSYINLIYAESVPIARLNGTLYLTGTGDSILTTTDGATFSRVLSTGSTNSSAHTDVNTANANQAGLVDAGDYIWFMSSVGGLVRISKSDASHRQVIDSSVIFRDVAFLNGTYVAVGDGGVVFSSTDTLNWTSRTSGTATNIISVMAGNGIFVLASTSYTARSTDGITWTNASFASGVLQSAFSNGHFYLFANAGLYVSTNGTSWQFLFARGSFNAMKPWSKGVIVFGGSGASTGAYIVNAASAQYALWGSNIVGNVIEIGDDIWMSNTVNGYTIFNTLTGALTETYSTVGESPITTQWYQRGRTLENGSLATIGPNVVRIGSSNQTMLCYTSTSLSFSMWNLSNWISENNNTIFLYLSGLSTAIDTPSFLFVANSTGYAVVPKIVINSMSMRIAPMSTFGTQWQQDGSTTSTVYNTLVSYRKIN